MSQGIILDSIANEIGGTCARLTVLTHAIGGLDAMRMMKNRKGEDAVRETVMREAHNLETDVAKLMLNFQLALDDKSDAPAIARTDAVSDEITDGMLRWEPRTLSTKTLERILMDALADLWMDCYRSNDSAGRQNQRNLFCEKVSDAIQSATGANGLSS